jgi:hypothetical protein
MSAAAGTFRLHRHCQDSGNSEQDRKSLLLRFLGFLALLYVLGVVISLAIPLISGVRGQELMARTAEELPDAARWPLRVYDRIRRGR